MSTKIWITPEAFALIIFSQIFLAALMLMLWYMLYLYIKSSEDMYNYTNSIQYRSIKKNEINGRYSNKNIRKKNLRNTFLRVFRKR